MSDFKLFDALAFMSKSRQTWQLAVMETTEEDGSNKREEGERRQEGKISQSKAEEGSGQVREEMVRKGSKWDKLHTNVQYWKL